VNLERIKVLMAGWEGRRVAVLGDVMLDRYLWGVVDRISPEAPVPVLHVERESFRLGGAANVANTVLALGARPLLLGVTGADAGAEHLAARLAEEGLSSEGRVRDPARPTTVKSRVIARSHHLVRFDHESREELPPPVVDALAGRMEELFDGVAAVVISDYGKGVITGPLLERVLQRCREGGVPVCVDPKDTHFFSYRGVAVVTPNQHEAAGVLGYKLRDDRAVGRAGEELLERLGAAAVLITRGGDGMSLFEQGDGKRTDFPAVARQVYDVTGAGDTVVGTYAVALAGGATAAEAASLANRAAGDVVQRVGTAVPRREALVEDGD